MMAAAEEAKMVKEARLAKEKEEEQLFRDAMLQKFAEEDKLEQMSAQRRRMKQNEHKREIEERAERFRQEIIERERQRLLEEHLPHLNGNVPKGVLQKEEDMVYLAERQS